LSTDVASRHNKGIFGIEVKTLDLIKLHKKNSALNLSTEIENMLDEYLVSIDQIYIITSEYGQNIIKTVKYFSKEFDTAPDEDFDKDEILNDARAHSLVSIRCAVHSM